MNDMTVGDINAQIAELTAEKERRLSEARESFTQRVIDEAQDIGIDIKAVAAAFLAAIPRKRKHDNGYTLNSDPTKIYVRGKLPQWMIDAIREAGYDPDSNVERSRFRDEHMTKVG